MASLDSLPEELQFLILEFLDTTPPSHLRLRKEPCLTLTDNEDRTLKHISSISKRWRRLVLPMLFKYTRLRLDNPLQAEWNACTVCNGSAMATVNAHAAVSLLSGPIDRYHTAMVTAAKLSQRLTGVPLGGSGMDAHSEDANASNTLPSTTFPWIARFYHALKDFIGFLQRNDLTDIVESFVLYTDRMLEAKLHRFPHEAADKDWRFPASAAFWSHLLAVIEPFTITILAPPLDLACLTNCAVDTFGDWAFGEMDYHILTLRQTKTCNSAKALPSYSSLRSIPTTYPSIATSSILNLRPWTHLGLNEGPFLKAYGTYEFFERGPPSIVYSIKDSIIRRPRQQTQSTTASPTNDNTFIVQPLHNLSSLDYTAIFPFSNHADFSSILHQISHLSLQLAPDSSSNILNDRVRLGKADLADCWTELLTTYAQLVEPLATVRRPSTAQTVSGAEIFGGEFTWDTNWHDVAVRRLEALDFRIKAMQGELDELFTPLCLPVWVETPEGVFSRMGQEDEGANEES